MFVVVANPARLLARHLLVIASNPSPTRSLPTSLHHFHLVPHRFASSMKQTQLLFAILVLVVKAAATAATAVKMREERVIATPGPPLSPESESQALVLSGENSASAQGEIIKHSKEKKFISLLFASNPQRYLFPCKILCTTLFAFPPRLVLYKNYPTATSTTMTTNVSFSASLELVLYKNHPTATSAVDILSTKQYYFVRMVRQAYQDFAFSHDHSSLFSRNSLFVLPTLLAHYSFFICLLASHCPSPLIITYSCLAFVEP
jgi:hypothetical protein